MRSIALAALLCLAPLSTALAEPAFFSSQPYAEARASAAEGEKLFFVKGTAVWCGPCKMMDRNTFADERVKDWLTTNAISVSVDVDDHPELAAELKIRAMPTMVLFRGDEELGRAVGYRGPDELLGWLAAAKAGELPKPGEEQDMRARLQAARDLVHDGELVKATEEYVWLWHNMLDHDRGFYGVRLSFMASDIERLIARHGPARREFTAIRDAAADKLREGGDWQLLHDWLVLNDRILHDREQIIAWINRVRDRPGGLEAILRFDRIVFEVLVAEGEWSLYGDLIGNTEGQVLRVRRRYEEGIARSKRDDRADERYLDYLRGEVRRSLAEMHAALLAAGREDEAWIPVEEALRLLDDEATRRTIVETARQATQLRPRHGELEPGRG